MEPLALQLRFEDDGEVAVCFRGDVVVRLGVPDPVAPMLEPSSRPMPGHGPRQARWETVGKLQILRFPGMRIAALHRDGMDTLLVAAAGQLPFKLERGIKLLGGFRTAGGYYFSVWVDPENELLERELWGWMDFGGSFFMLVEESDFGLIAFFDNGTRVELGQAKHVEIVEEELEVGAPRKLSLYCFESFRVAVIAGGDQKHPCGFAGVAGVTPAAMYDQLRPLNLVAVRRVVATPDGDAIALKPWDRDARFLAFADFLTEHLWTWFYREFQPELMAITFPEGCE